MSLLTSGLTLRIRIRYVFNLFEETEIDISSPTEHLNGFYICSRDLRTIIHLVIGLLIPFTLLDNTLHQTLSVVIKTELEDITKDDIGIRSINEHQLSLIIIKILLIILSGCKVVLPRGKPQVMGWINRIRLQFVVVHPHMLVVRARTRQVLLYVQMVIFVRDTFTRELTAHVGNMILDIGIRLSDILDGVLRIGYLCPKRQE